MRCAHSRTTISVSESVARTSGTLSLPVAVSRQWIAATVALPRPRRSMPARLPQARTASPLAEARAAHSSNGSWLPAMIGGRSVVAVEFPDFTANHSSICRRGKSSLPVART